MAEQEQPDPAAMQQAFNRLAGALQEPQARERLRSDPRAFLEANGIKGLPDTAVAALSDLTPQELALFVKVQKKLGEVPADVPGGYEVCIVF